MTGDDFPTIEAYACFVAAEAGDGQRDSLRFAKNYAKYATAIVALGDVPESPERYYERIRGLRAAYARS